MNPKNKILTIIALILASLFITAVFKNIGYPLLWNDEAETAMYAERILEYGYPKVHDGKNVLYLLELPVYFGINKNSDAYLGNGWGQYYFCATGAFLARHTDNMYTKTLLLRIPFAFIGLMGIFIFAFSIMNLFKSATAKLLFFIFFILLELSSIPLILHLRQVRSYSLVIFLSALIFYTYLKHSLFKKTHVSIYIPAIAILLFLLFNTFPPAYFVFLITLGLYEFIILLKTKQIKLFAIGLSPLFISVIPVIFLLFFFNTFNISRVISEITSNITDLRYRHFLRVITFFQRHEFLDVIAVAKIFLAGLWLCFCKKQSKILNDTAIKQRLWTSCLLTLFFVVYALIIINIPLPALLQRYFIPLQPVLIIILLLDISVIFDLLYSARAGRLAIISTVILFILPFSFAMPNKINNIKNYIYELTHQYYGPLDSIIPFIKYTYPNAEDLVIATNYEECAYMYYLNSKVIIGYTGNNLEEDLKMHPDIIVFRKRWAFTNKPEIFDTFLKKDKYKKAFFAIYDYPVNTIPELGGTLPHLFKTKFAEKDGERLEICVKDLASTVKEELVK